MCVNDMPKIALDSADTRIEPMISDHETNALTTTPTSHSASNYGQIVCSTNNNWTISLNASHSTFLMHWQTVNKMDEGHAHLKYDMV